MTFFHTGFQVVQNAKFFHNFPYTLIRAPSDDDDDDDAGRGEARDGHTWVYNFRCLTMWACPSGHDDGADGDRGEARDGYTTFVAGLRGSAPGHHHHHHPRGT